MNKLGIIFGTDTGTTRLIAKKMWKALGAKATKPVNINRVTIEEFLAYDALILGTPSYGEGQVPGVSTGIETGSWEEFLPQLDTIDLTGKKIALYGLGNQDKYTDRFASGMNQLYQIMLNRGAEIVGRWPTDGYSFEHSDSVHDGEFVGLVLDQNNQAMMTEARISQWLEMISPDLAD